MKTFHLDRELAIARPLKEVFAFFSNPKNLEAITPPWLRFQIRDASEDPLRKGSQIRYRLKVHGFPMGWTSLISTWNPPYSFVDEQVRGPYRVWHHTHTFTPQDGGTVLGDDVVMRPRGGPLAPLVMRCVRSDVARIFTHRAKVMAEVFGGSEDRASVRWTDQAAVSALAGAR